jgi:single-stranded-DNA-specific exonuclease
MTIRARLAEAPASSEIEPQGRAVLGVERSATGRRWSDRLGGAAAERALAIAQRHGVPDLVARVVAGRGVAPEDAAGYLDPTVKSLMPEPYSLRDMERAAGRLARAVAGRERIALLGDYDVDGAVCVALAARFLGHFGLEPLVHIPDRVFEGYGPSLDAVRRLKAEGATLLVTLDCGTSSHAALAEAAALGLETVVIDHHQADEALPRALAVVNPNRQDDLSGQGHLSAAGVAFLVLVAVNRLLRGGKACISSGEPPLLDWLELVALSTVCDVVPLLGLNRAYVAKGLVGMRRRRLAGLRALQDVARLSGPPTCHHLGFLLGPRINAGGRIGDAALGARLLTTDDESVAQSIAIALDRYNAERQTLETLMLDQAMAQAERSLATEPDRPLILAASEAWHPGIVGIIASRLRERYGRPAFALAFGDGGLATGSGRSIPGVDLGTIVRSAAAEGLLVKGGGHAMAAGLTVARDRVVALEAYFSERLLQAVSAARTQQELLIDGALSAGAATFRLIDQIERAGPFGAGNPAPLFVLAGHRIAHADVVSAGNHLRARLAAADGSTLDAIAFRSAETPVGRSLLAARGGTLHVAGRLQLDHWNGNARVKLHVEDVARVTPD